MSESDELELRTRRFAVRVVKLCRALPRSREAEVFTKQLLRSGTAVAANYRSARRARSSQEFASRLAVVIEEADENCFWLGMIADAELVRPARLVHLRDEATQLLKIFSATRRTVLQKITNRKSQITNP